MYIYTGQHAGQHTCEQMILCLLARQTETDRDRQRQTETDRDRQRQTDRQTGRQTDGLTVRQTDEIYSSSKKFGIDLK